MSQLYIDSPMAFPDLQGPAGITDVYTPQAMPPLNIGTPELQDPTNKRKTDPPAAAVPVPQNDQPVGVAFGPGVNPVTRWAGPPMHSKRKILSMERETQRRMISKQRAGVLKAHRTRGRELGIRNVSGINLPDVQAAVLNEIEKIRAQPEIARAYGQDASQIALRAERTFRPYTQEEVNALTRPTTWNAGKGEMKMGQPLLAHLDGEWAGIPRKQLTNDLTHAYGHYYDPKGPVPKVVVKYLVGKFEMPKATTGAQADARKAHREALKAQNYFGPRR